MVVATGFFDGVHTGHRELINELVSMASERHTDSLVITFWPHPRIVLHPDEHFPGLLTSLEERRAKLLEYGVDRVEVIEFTKEFSSLTASGFIDEYVRRKFGADALVMGYDNRLGCDLKGSEEIRSAFAGCSPEILIAGRKDSDGMAISSTRIRRALSEGNIEQASAMLGYDYTIGGVVVHGQKLGRKLGFPTANLEMDEPLKVIPAHGAYYVKVRVCGEEYGGMCNVGVRPTVGGSCPVIEAHLFGFDREIYGEKIEISFVRRIRGEKKFSGLEELKRQLEMDKKLCIFGK
ncbi:MAG: riboflavin biosynthesis protein RibF [Bacteroidales bacterium]|nr:riboflavin biosynthesis protein RibF [Bacteroidales bacterium]